MLSPALGFTVVTSSASMPTYLLFSVISLISVDLSLLFPSFETTFSLINLTHTEVAKIVVTLYQILGTISIIKTRKLTLFPFG